MRFERKQCNSLAPIECLMGGGLYGVGVLDNGTHLCLSGQGQDFIDTLNSIKF